jgi:pimeloyl-ACP methyl ester carboxylesterase
MARLQRTAARRRTVGLRLAHALVLLLLAAGCTTAGSPSAGTPPPDSATPAAASVPSAAQSASAAVTEGFEVVVNGLRVVGHCTGARADGAPIVVLQSGTGGSDTHLAGIEEHLAGRTKVCAWSRPGAGGSDAPAELPRSVTDVVAEMREILAAIDAQPPFFVVGQSGGAVVTFMFAQAFPTEVAGFVAMNPNPAYGEWMAMADREGIAAQFVGLAEADYRGNNPEGIDFTANDRMLTDPLPPTMPYAVMYDEECSLPDCSELLAPEAAVQERLAEVGDGGRFVWAHGAGHEIHATMPDLVNSTIEEVWSQATD